MVTKIHEYHVEMTCGGCSGAVERVLGKMTGIENVKIDLDNKKVEVTTSRTPDEILECIKKTGKSVTFVKTT